MKKNILMFISICVSYLIVDMTYQLLIGIQLNSALFEKAGISTIFTDLPNPILILLFFILITIANMVFVVIPALEKKSLAFAFSRAILLGATAYGTLALVLGWWIESYPRIAILTVFLEGPVFSTIASTFTTWLFLKKAQ